MTKVKDYVIVSNYFDEGWKQDTMQCFMTMEDAWTQASALAKELDHKYGDTHFWNVNLNSKAGDGIVQLFHGRLI